MQDDREDHRRREFHRRALAILARGTEERVTFAKGTGPIPIVLVVRTFTLLS